MKNFNKFFLLILSVLLMALGAVVMFGWFIKNINIVQIFPTLVPMQFNTALCFFIAGLIFVGLQYHKLKESYLLSIFIFLISFLTLIQYFFGVNLGIDNLFINHSISIKTYHLGRMAPNTALSFFCFSIVVIFIKKRKLSKILLYISSIILILGLMSLLGYLFNIEQGYAWGGLTHMALHTSIGFIIIGVGLINFLLKNQENIIVKENLFEVISLILILSLSLAVWLNLKSNLISKIDLDTDDYLQIISSKLKVRLETDIEAIVRISSRYNTNSYKDNKALEIDVSFYFHHMPFLKGIYLKDKKNNNGQFYVNKNANIKSVKNILNVCKKITSQKNDHKYLNVTNFQINNKNYLCMSQKNFLGVMNVTEILNLFTKESGESYNVKILRVDKERATNKSNNFFAKQQEVDLYSTKYSIIVDPNKNYIKKSVDKSLKSYLLILFVITSLLLLLIKIIIKLFLKEKTIKYIKELNFRILNSVTESIIGIDLNKKISFINSESKKLLEITDSNIKKNNLSKVLIQDSLEKNIIIEKIEKTIETKKSHKVKNIKLVTSKGKSVPVTISLSPIFEGQKLIGILLVLFDLRERLAYEKKLEQLAFYDSLTFLPNRYSIMSQIESSIKRFQRYNKSFALLFLDINKFKNINDTYGHHVGDDALLFVSKQFSSVIRGNDYLGRLSGDEFCLIIEDINKESEVNDVIRKLKNSLNSPFKLQDIEINITVSIGYVIYEKGMSAEDILSKADKEMYYDKKSNNKK